MEEWRDVVGFEGVYAVSSLGRIMRVAGGVGATVGSIKKPCPNRCGYFGTQLSRGGKTYSVRVHRVVAEAFLGPCPDGCEVNHKNGDKTDNRVENLEWITHQENKAHAYRVLNCNRARGETVYSSKLTPDDVRDIREAYRLGAFSMHELAKWFGVSQPAIWKIVNRLSWDHID